MKSRGVKQHLTRGDSAVPPADNSSKEELPSKALWGLCRRRRCLVPTWRGWLLLLCLLAGTLWLALHTVYPFLALNSPVSSSVLVVEGWAPDYALQIAASEFTNHPYEKIFVTGGPFDQGGPLSEYKTFAELGTATLLKLGLGTNFVQPVPAPWVAQDRTYTSAVTLKRWLREHNEPIPSFNLVTVGPHARRSRLMFKMAFGKDVKIGVITIPIRDYDPQRWWRSSAGVRTVTGELLAYSYARLLFHP